MRDGISYQQQTLENAFHWHKVLPISLAYAFPWFFAVLRWQTRKRKSLVLQFRNPPVVFFVAAYTYVSCVLETLQLFTPQGLCISEYFTRSSAFSFLDGPLTVRAAQYLLVMNESLRRRFRGRYRTPGFATWVSLFFGLYNMLSFHTFFWGIVRYPAPTYIAACTYADVDAYYAFLLTLFFFSMAIFFTCKLRRQYDVYLVAKETRMFCFLTATATCAMYLGSYLLGSPFGIPGWRCVGIMVVVYYISCFLLLVLYPLWVDHQHSHKKKTLQKQSHSGLIRVQSQLTETRDISDLMCDALVSDLLSEFARARFVPEISRFLQAEHKYRQMADSAIPDEREPGPTCKQQLVWHLGLRQAYLSMLSEFFMPDSPYELNLEAGVLERAAALVTADAWREVPAAKRSTVFDEARHEVTVLFDQNFGPEFHAELVRVCHRRENGGEEKSWLECRPTIDGAMPPAQRGWYLRSTALRSKQRLQGGQVLAI